MSSASLVQLEREITFNHKSKIDIYFNKNNFDFGFLTGFAYSAPYSSSFFNKSSFQVGTLMGLKTTKGFFRRFLPQIVMNTGFSFDL